MSIRGIGSTTPAAIDTAGLPTRDESWEACCPRELALLRRDEGGVPKADAIASRVEDACSLATSSFCWSADRC
jgi:hypothetical protein